MLAHLTEMLNMVNVNDAKHQCVCQYEHGFIVTMP